MKQPNGVTRQRGSAVCPSMTLDIEIAGLSKRYDRWRGAPAVAVSDLNLAVPSGGVFGFLGPNGSGKTTTIRCLLGLVHATGGEMRLLGRPVPAALPEVMRQVGAIVETPALFPTMTARENLLLLAAIDRIGARRVDEVLATVGLTESARRAVRTYSLGMRQRLGLAAALLKDPALLVLDEPANGLDPAGMRETRQLLRRLADEGRTVFLSSHLLSEIEQTCDHVAIIDRGRLVLAGAVQTVLAEAAQPSVLVAIDRPDDAVGVLRRAGFVAEHAGSMVRVQVLPDDAANVTRHLAAAGLFLTEMRPEVVSLEDLFLEMTAHAPEPEEVAA